MCSRGKKRSCSNQGWLAEEAADCADDADRPQEASCRHRCRTIPFDLDSSYWQNASPMSRAAWIFLIPVAVAATYGPFLHAPFAYDDRIHILENEQVTSFRSLLDVTSLRRLSEHAFGLEGRPLLFLSYGLNYASAGPDPAAFRFINLAIHAANSLLVFLIMLELGRRTSFKGRERFRFGIFAAMLFAVHPLLTESMTYIAGRSSSFCATFYFAGLFLVLRAGTADRIRQTLFVILAIICVALSWLVKQDAITLPLAAIAVVWLAWPESVPRPQRAVATGICLLFLVSVLILETQSIAGVLDTTQSNQALVSAGFEPTIPLVPYALTSIKEFAAYYLWRMCLPIQLSVDPDVGVIDTPLSAGFLFSLVLLTALAATAWWSRRREPLIAAGVALVLVSPLSAYCVFPLADVVAEHRAYISVLGAAVVIAAAISKFPRAALLSGAVILSFGWLTVERNGIWDDEVLLWRDAASKSPGKLRPQLNLGALYQTRGKPDEAILEYESVLRRYPDNATALSNLASLYLARNDLQKTEELLNRAIARQTRFAAVYLNLAVVRLRQRRFAESRELLEHARTLNPRQAMVHHNLGDLFFNENHPDRAVEEYLTELRINPNSAITHLNLAKAYEAIGSPANSLEHYLFLQRLDPNNAEVQAALRRLR